MNAFLLRNGWGKARSEPLAGDASSRRYARLTRDGQTAILMQDPDGDVALFARLARHLKAIGLSAPGIMAQDVDSGQLLIEDLGDGLIARLAGTPETERTLYSLATEALIALHRHDPPSGLPLASPDRLAGMIDLAFLHYTHAPAAMAAAIAAFRPLLEAHALPADVMILRDYHAENILHLPDRTGPARAGLLDFQDALRGHRAYDLISLLEDARRDVAPDTRAACIAQYLSSTGVHEADFLTSLSVLGAQRNLRILGVFARLAATRGKPHYIALIPRVWGHLQNDLAHPALAPIRDVLQDALPAPTADLLQRLKTECPTP